MKSHVKSSSHPGGTKPVASLRGMHRHRSPRVCLRAFTASLAAASSLLLLSSCAATGLRINTSNDTFVESFSRSFGFEIHDDSNLQEPQLRLVSVYPRARIDAGTIMPSRRWEHEFILDALDSQVEIGETFAECNAPLDISFIKESEKSYRLRIAIIPTPENEALRCIVRVPVSKDGAVELLSLEINAVVSAGI